MSDTTEFKATLSRYLKARIPFISIRSAERSRVLDLLREVGAELQAPIYVHTLSQGTRELGSNRAVNDDRSVTGAVDFASQQFPQRQNLSVVLTEVSDIEDDTPAARHLLDVVMLAAENSRSTRARPAAPIRSRKSASRSSSTTRAASPASSPASTREPVSPSTTVSRGPPRRVLTTGLPLAIASTFTMP